MTNLLAAAMIVPIVGICILGVIGVVAWILLSSRDTRARTHGGPAGAAEQHARTTMRTAVVLFGASVAIFGIVGGGFFSSADRIGAMLFVLPPTALFLGVMMVGEIAWPRPTGALRTASLTPRTIRDVSPRRLRIFLFASLGALALITGAGALTASEDGTGFDREGPLWGSSHSGYPGPTYAVVTVLTACLIIVGTYVVLGLVARRPAVPRVAETFDNAIRRRSATRILRIAQLPINALSALTAMKMGGVLQRAGDIPEIPEAHSPAMILLGTALTIVGVAWLCASLAACVLPRSPAIELEEGPPDSAAGPEWTSGTTNAQAVR